MEGLESGKNFSEEKIKNIQELTAKVREVVEWDLGKFAHDIEDIEIVNKAKSSLEDLETIFDMPKTRFWASPERGEHKPRPITAKTFSPEDISKIKENLKNVQEVVEWDINGGDEIGMQMIRDAKDAMHELDNIFS